MLEFPSHDGVEIYAGAGVICFASNGEIENTEPQRVFLTIGQFRAVIKNAKELIEQAEHLKMNPYEGDDNA